MNFILFLLQSFFLVVPIVAYKYAKKNYPKRRNLITGIAMGLIITPSGFGLYGFYYIPYIGLIPGIIGLMLVLFHGEPGYLIATYFGLHKPGTVVEYTGHILPFFIDGIIWGSIYGLVGFILDTIRQRKNINKVIERVQG